MVAEMRCVREDAKVPVILIVDDVVENIRLLKNLLEDFGRIVFARSGREALAQAAHHLPDLILLDVLMPDMDGYETCRLLKAQAATRDIPLIFVTSADAESDEEYGLALGAIDYITKPFAPAIVRARVRNHLARKEMEKQLAAAEQARRQWIADTSHELRTPITILNSHLEAIRDGVVAADEHELGILLGTVQRMEKLAADLHDLAHTDAGPQALHLAELDVAELIQNTHAVFVPQFAAHGMTFTLDNRLPDGLRIHGDAMRLMQVLSNLCSNSLRYTDSGGQARLEAELVNGHVQLALLDSAPGVPAEALPRLFERFYRVDASRNRASGGSGLGLAICQSIVLAHGGRIAASASPLGGLAVQLWLPLPAEDGSA
jgi:signal transduction histidine kinase